MTEVMVPGTEGAARRDALIRAVGFDKLSEPQRELALAIAQRYELDPMLKHVVMIEGRPYITRDGLLHVAHRSGVFDGIEVSDPVLDETADAGGRRYWRARCTVWRKDFSRPFVYPGRYPLQGGNAKYAEEMAVKVAEVMTLRRAFDVSAPTVEERWDDDEHAELEQPAQPATLAERVAIRAAVVRDASDGETVDEGTFVAPAGGFAPEPDTFSIPATPEPLTPQEAFAEWAATQDRQEIIAATRRLFPDVGRFGDLDPEQLEAIQNEVERAGLADDDVDEAELLEELAPVATQDAPGGEATPEAASAADPEPDEDQGPFVKPVLCGAESPLTGNACTLDAGHKGVHRAGLREAW